MPGELGQAGTSLPSGGADARTGQLIYVDCACKITEVRGGEAGQPRFGMEAESRSAEMPREEDYDVYAGLCPDGGSQLPTPRRPGPVILPPTDGQRTPTS